MPSAYQMAWMSRYIQSMAYYTSFATLTAYCSPTGKERSTVFSDGRCSISHHDMLPRYYPWHFCNTQDIASM
eukprot:8414669-Karenia_brevis.AAC.1